MWVGFLVSARRQPVRAESFCFKYGVAPSAFLVTFLISLSRFLEQQLLLQSLLHFPVVADLCLSCSSDYKVFLPDCGYTPLRSCPPSDVYAFLFLTFLKDEIMCSFSFPTFLSSWRYF